MHPAGLQSLYVSLLRIQKTYPPITIPLMHSMFVTLPKLPDDDLLIVGKHSFLISNSLSIWSDQSKVCKSISIVRLALLESVEIVAPLVSFYKK